MVYSAARESLVSKLRDKNRFLFDSHRSFAFQSSDEQISSQTKILVRVEAERSFFFCEVAAGNGIKYICACWENWSLNTYRDLLPGIAERNFSPQKQQKPDRQILRCAI